MSRAAGRTLIVVVLVLVLALIFGGRLVSLYVDYLWFGSLGYNAVFLTVLWARLVMFLVGSLGFFALFLANVLLARAVARQLMRRAPVVVAEPPPRSSGPFGAAFGGMGGLVPSDAERPRPFGDLAATLGGPEIGRWVLERIGVQLALIAGVGLSLVMGLAASGWWEAVLRVLYATPFHVADPVFGHDVSFYVFSLPLLRFLQGWLFWALLLAAAAAVGLYALALYTIDPSFEHAAFYLLGRARAMRTHLLVLVGLLLALMAAGAWLGSYDVLVSRHERMMGANFTDIHARLPAVRALAAAAAVGALLVVASIFRRDYTLPLLGAVLLAAVLVVGRGVLPLLVQKLQVEPAELAQERPYIDRNIRLTRQAFGLQGVAEQTLPAEDAVSPEEVRANKQTVSNIRLWDHRPLKDTYNQLQSIRQYYAFDDVDVDRYTIDGQYRQVMLSGREISVGRLGEQAQTWVNRRLQYTHGYGLAMSPVNEISPEGLPALFVQDVPPAGRLRIDRPEIYYGEQTAGYVIVNTGTQEFDYPRGDQNVFTTYEGAGGVPIGPLWRRLALAWYLGDFNLLVSPYLRPDSRVLLRRLVRDRVQHLAPFLKLDRDPYLVVADGGLFWMLDAYTTTDRYPYAQRVIERVAPAGLGEAEPAPPAGPAAAAAQAGLVRSLAYNYIRNSAKITVNAYDGSVRVYLADPEDPIARTYTSIFPDLLRPLSEMPAALRAHVRYPEDLFRVQAQVMRSYHVQDPQVFYNSEDVWGAAFESLGDRRQAVDPYYVIMRLPGEPSEEFLLMLPFTPATRDNMIAWLAARSDGDKYGKLLLYKFPKDRLVYGPAQIEARIDQDPVISAQLTLWNQQGSRVIRGNLLVIPVGNSTLYAEPIYLQAERSQLPELKRVVVATGNRLVMEPTLTEGLTRLFGADIGLAPAAAAQPAEAAGQGTASSSTADQGPPGAPVTAVTGSAARAARETYQRAIDALRAGDFARFGEELKSLDDQLAELERAGGP